MAKHVLETVGEVCPFPLIEAKKAIAELPVGDELVINFDCTQATESIPEWAAESGYPVTEFKKAPDFGWVITVQKAH
ncbi:sulfurtransferase TusA family protein [Luteococcus sp. OSA5]|uniref:sulfurtransferase TusA family protein n=1 Tax=unclassified Luteococcus TaxID=2639923 RepID=UPI003B434D84